MKPTFQNKICVVTGGSSGIGLSIATRLARQRARLLLVARDRDALASAAATLRASGAAEVVCLSADVGDEEQLAALAPAIAEMGPAADLVVNAAGVVSAGLLDEIPMAEWRRLLDINVLGVVGVLDATLPAMRRRAQAGGPGGHVLNIASAAGLTGFPGMSAYCASKFAIVGLSESLRAELAALNIGVTAVCPGFVKTPIAGKVALFGRMEQPRIRRNIEAMFQRNDLSPDTVADVSLRAVARNQALAVIGRDAAAGYWTKRIAPGLLRRVTRSVALKFTRATAS